MAGPKAGQGMQEGRRYFALARSLIGSAPTGIVNMRMSLNKGVGIRCPAFSLERNRCTEGCLGDHAFKNTYPGKRSGTQFEKAIRVGIELLHVDVVVNVAADRTDKLVSNLGDDVAV